uniref:Uncharacterized protein n=1 Tax=Percolomonas cosmopolitus TaxID=63605 RepID=A0A7S1KND8_9EUKA|mmetsp:Transcript_2627/g.10048  ORF Transcript_2627/g.10048 Transcript_2627/m.10048 type:complete len:244 (+) Transcript_2627:158-889(+)
MNPHYNESEFAPPSYPEPQTYSQNPSYAPAPENDTTNQQQFADDTKSYPQTHQFTGNYPQQPQYVTSPQEANDGDQHVQQQSPMVNSGLVFQPAPQMAVPTDADVIQYDPNNAMQTNPVIGLLLSLFFFPGIGQLCIGQTRKGIYFIVFTIVYVILFLIIFVIFAYFGYFILLPIFGMVPLLLVEVVTSIDAYKMGLALKDRGYIYQGECYHEFVTTFTGLKFFVGRKMRVFTSGSRSDPRNL